MKYSAALLVIVIMLLLMTLPKQAPNSGIPDMAAIMDQAPNERFRTVFAKLLRQLVERNHVMDHVLTGDFLLRYGYCEEACAIYRLGIHKDPTHYQALAGFAVSLDELGYLEDAIAAYAAANAYAEEQYQITENTQRQGELYLRLERVDAALNIFESLNYAPALVKRCRIYIHLGHYEKSKADFKILCDNDEKDESLEVYQLNALAERHFGKSLGDINPHRERELIYSEHIPLQMRKSLAEHTFGMHGQDLYTDSINRLPFIDSDSHVFSDQHIISASHDPQKVAAGAAIYRKSNCIVCHGPEAYGATGPNLRDAYWLTENISPSTMYLSIHNGRNKNTMPAYKDLLSPEQIRDVCGWLIERYRKTERDAAGKCTQGKAAEGTRQELLQ